MASRRAAQEQPVILSPTSSNASVREWLSSVLTAAQYSQVTEKWAEDDLVVDGRLLFSCSVAELRSKVFGMSQAAGRKVAPLLKQLQAQADDEEEEDQAMGEGSTTPVGEGAELGPAELALTAAATHKVGAGRAALPGGRQARLSQPIQMLPVGGPERRITRQRASRMVAVELARTQRAVKMEAQDAHMGSNPAARDGQDSDQDTYSDEEMTEEETEMAAPPRNRRAQQQIARAGPSAAAAQQQQAGSALPEEDDGVHPDNGASWADAVRECLPEILKHLPLDDLKQISDEEDFPTDVYRIKRFNRTSNTHVWGVRSRPVIASRITKMLLDGQLKPGRTEAHRDGIMWQGVDELLDKYVPEEYVKSYLEDVLKKQFAAVPAIQNTRKALWRLWCRPAPPSDPELVHLGCITIPFYRAGIELRYQWEQACAAASNGVQPSLSLNVIKGMLDAPAEGAAMVKGEDGAMHPVAQAQLILMKNDQVDYADLVRSTHNLLRRGNALQARCSLDLTAATLGIDLSVRMEKGRGEAMINCCFTLKNEEDGLDLVQVYLDTVFGNMDHLKGTAFTEVAVERLNQAWDAACDDLAPEQPREGRQPEAWNVPTELLPPHQLNSAIFDRILAHVEDLERPLMAGVEQEAENRLALRLKAYQLRALSFMLQEERAEGGTARHLWAQVPLPGGQQGVEVFISPATHQIYVSKSKIATQQAIGTSGGCGWQALEMGMGKTAVVLAGILFNPPPPGWRNERTWKAFDKEDYMATVADNMPRGGTLVVVPSTITRQWMMELEKTLANPDELSVMCWLDRDRSWDCNEIAKADIVLTTPQMATSSPHLRHIFWHRIVVDEAQLNAGSVLTGDFFSTHRWIVTGTPCNAQPESLAPSLHFLRFTRGGWGDAQRFLPPSIATVLRAGMLRYTKAGRINGETNLELPPLTQRVVACTLKEADAEYYVKENVELYWRKFQSHIRAGIRKAVGDVGAITVETALANPAMLNQLAGSGKIQSRRMSGYVSFLRALTGGGQGAQTAEREYNAALGKEVPILHWFTSKADAVIEELKAAKERDPNAKILVFSEFNETLKAIGERLPSIGLDFRSVLGSTSAKKRGDAIEAFMTDPPTKVFLLSAKAGAVGITLTAASEVIICEPLMNAALELQAIGRSRRMGQTKAVTVTRLYTEGSIEERVRAMVARKAGVRATSTAMATNVGAGEMKCSLADWNELLKCEDKEESEEEEESDFEDLT